MCGIAGIIALGNGAPRVDATELDRMRDAMIPRGPDGCGSWVSADGVVGLGHRRLAIIDLSEGGAQPMHDAETGCTIAFNGEIYNFQEIRRDLEARGHRFRSTSDTEVLLKAYAAFGEDMLPRLRGMFAFCIWDPRKRKALLARDPLGIKPLYVAEHSGTVRFASQVKAILAGGGPVDRTRDLAARTGFFIWGSIPEPHTLYRGIRMLPAGTCAWVGDRGLERPHVYFDLQEEVAAGEAAGARPIERGRWLEELRAALARSVAAHLIADVPVGVFLSAGIDSTTIAALAREARPSESTRTLTLAYTEFKGKLLDESPLAEEVARLIGADHRTVAITGADFEGELASVLHAMDQPTVDAVNTYFVTKAAREAGLKVVLSGVGGDELFGGYAYYRRIPQMLRWLKLPGAVPGLGAGMRMLGAPIAERLGQAKAASLLEYGGAVPTAYLLNRALHMPWEVSRLMDPAEAKQGLAELDTAGRMQATVAGIQDPQLQLCALDLVWYMRNQLLRDSDWASMAHSLELRTPLVDAWLLRDVIRLRAGGMRIAKSEVSRAVDTRIHALLASRPKTGFYIPVGQWMPKELRDAAGRGNPYRQWARFVLEKSPTA
jgi:asparagine synthase (glutamine-hydrolysing)